MAADMNRGLPAYNRYERLRKRNPTIHSGKIREQYARMRERRGDWALEEKKNSPDRNSSKTNKKTRLT